MQFNYQILGLESRDIHVYESLIEHEDIASVRNIALWTGLNRGVVFNCLKKLLAQGLVASYQRGKQKRYYANNPSILEKLLDYKIDEIISEKSSVNEYVIRLQQGGRVSVPSQFSALYEGEAEIAALLRDVLSTTENLSEKNYRIISSEGVRAYLYSSFKNYTKQRVERGISVKVLSAGMPGAKAALSEVRTMPMKGIKAPACYIIIYGDKVAQISLHDDLIPYGIVTINKELAVIQQILFDQVWDSIKYNKI
jgi:sugar-specific transcriptional regulator TrmB